MNRTWTCVIVAAFTLAGCREKQTANSQPMPGMDTMPRMAGMGHRNMRADSLMPAMRAHLDSVATVPVARLPGTLTAHESMTSLMLDAMGSDMTAMGMNSDGAWRVLSDSVRGDLADLPALRGPKLERMMRVHVDRMRRLLSMHESMMRAMPKS